VLVQGDILGQAVGETTHQSCRIHQHGTRRVYCSQVIGRADLARERFGIEPAPGLSKGRQLPRDRLQNCLDAVLGHGSVIATATAPIAFYCMLANLVLEVIDRSAAQSDMALSSFELLETAPDIVRKVDRKT
jgi:hypothetical protein